MVQVAVVINAPINYVEAIRDYGWKVKFSHYRRLEGEKEVVVVEYNPSIISKGELDKIAQGQKCAVSGGGSFRADSTPKYYLSNSEYKVVPMTEIQKCRVNSALAEKQDPRAFLSARQIAFLKTSSRNCVAISLKDCWM